MGATIRVMARLPPIAIPQKYQGFPFFYFHIFEKIPEMNNVYLTEAMSK